MKFKQKLVILSAILIAVLILSSGCIITAPPTPETPTVNTGTITGVVIGINNYIDPGIQDLRFCIADAQDLKNTLLNSTMWSSENIIYLPDATKSQIENAIKLLAGKVGLHSLILFYFSGHSTLSPDGSHVYICPADSSNTSFANDIKDDELERWLDSIPASRRCVILDTCDGGAFLKKPSPDLTIRTYLKMGQKVTRPLAGTGFYKKLSKAGYVVLTASDKNEYSQENSKLQNGVFTYYLVKGLNSPYGADINSNRVISAEESYHYTNPRVTAFTPSQHPQLYDGCPGELTIKTY